MTIPEMLAQSGMLTFLGMGVVFSFLIILIAFMKLVEILVRVTGLDKQKEASETASSANAGGVNGSVIAAIASALNEKKNK